MVIALSVKLAESRVKTLDQTNFGYILACIFVTIISRVNRFTVLTAARRNSHLVQTESPARISTNESEVLWYQTESS